MDRSPNGKIVVLVGSQIKIWRTRNYEEITFPSIIPSSKYIKFSNDNKFLAIATNSKVHLFTYDETLQFPEVKIITADASKGGISSIDFSPNDSTILAFGYISGDP